MTKRPTSHPDELVHKMIEIASKHGYGLVSVELTWFSDVPNSEFVTLEYKSNTEEKP